MAWYPEAVRKQLTVPYKATPAGRRPMRNPVRINVHTAVSNSYSLAWDERNGNRSGYFNTEGAGGVFSHFYIRADGVVEQMQDTAYEAACDRQGNHQTISIETWDGYKAGFPGYWKSDSDVPPLNEAQAEGLVKLLRWLLATHPSIPAKLATDNKREGITSHGLSWHRLGVPGYAKYDEPVGWLYTNSYKKGCPGARKIGQMAGILAAATTESEEDDMPYTRDQLLEIVETAVARQLWAPLVPDRSDVGGSSVRNNLLHQSLAATQTLALVRDLAARSGIDVDEAAIARDLVAGIAPALISAVTAKLDGIGGVDAGKLADEIVAELGAKLATPTA